MLLFRSLRAEISLWAASQPPCHSCQGQMLWVLSVSPESRRQPKRHLQGRISRDNSQGDAPLPSPPPKNGDLCKTEGNAEIRQGLLDLNEARKELLMSHQLNPTPFSILCTKHLTRATQRTSPRLSSGCFSLQLRYSSSSTTALGRRLPNRRGNGAKCSQYKHGERQVLRGV